VPVARIVEGDAVERELYLRVTARAGELRVQLLKAQASWTAFYVGQLFKRSNR
jgi:hypothetical protein